MSGDLHEYSQLIAAFREALQSEYSPEERLYCNAASYQYYKEFALNARKNQKQQAAAESTKPVELPYAHKNLSTNAKLTIPERNLKPSLSAPTNISQKTMAPSFPKEMSSQLPQQPPKKALLQEPPKEYTTSPTKGFALQQMDKGVSVNSQEFRKLFSDQFPQMRILDALPEEMTKQKTALKNSPEVVILVFNESPEQLAFLENVATAISAKQRKAQLISAKKVEQAKAWKEILTSKSLRLVIASKEVIQTLPELRQQYRASPQRSMHYLAGTFLIVLDNVAQYMQNTQLKRSLWNTLRSQLGI